MPRTARNVIDGGIYHVLTRGNNGQAVFHHDADYDYYLQLLERVVRAYQVAVYHFALLPNQTHLALEVIRGTSLSKAMQKINLSYTLFYRRRYRYEGHLWQGRFKSLSIHHGQLLECGRYIELQPVHTGLVQDPAAYPWTSYHVYTDGAQRSLIAPALHYEALGLTSDERRARYRQFVQEGLRLQRSPVDNRWSLLTRDSMRPREHLFGFPIARKAKGRPRKQLCLYYPDRSDPDASHGL